MENEKFLEKVIEFNGEFTQFIEREVQVYHAHAGRDANPDGLREHMRQMLAKNPAKMRAFCEDCARVIVEEQLGRPARRE